MVAAISPALAPLDGQKPKDPQQQTLQLLEQYRLELDELKRDFSARLSHVEQTLATLVDRQQLPQAEQSLDAHLQAILDGEPSDGSPDGSPDPQADLRPWRSHPPLLVPQNTRLADIALPEGLETSESSDNEADGAALSKAPTIVPIPGKTHAAEPSWRAPATIAPRLTMEPEPVADGQALMEKNEIRPAPQHTPPPSPELKTKPPKFPSWRGRRNSTRIADVERQLSVLTEQVATLELEKQKLRRRSPPKVARQGKGVGVGDGVEPSSSGAETEFGSSDADEILEHVRSRPQRCRGASLGLAMSLPGH
ncbi:hypothetical protein W97_02401 [Coniosporium apollinis CBS 100218]|uniref:Uncharacterized protein n=1 Tax=Coniosporium apollinis (strain CBS 100218) TaxID=1168221 RepID=R7YMZ7_CONA1|nr:uncharacterized protein W97_02401 [Coniosporium apollinis CBS 100218]EON63174.1 hypothetical protein W97_02401 [Coniosporium apollinis CBS 100218]